MPSDKDRKDIEIISPGQARYRDDQNEWIHISFGGDPGSFAKLPLHKRILLGAAWIAGALALMALIFLIVASAVLIWIPLLLAIGAITTAYIYFRSRFAGRR